MVVFVHEPPPPPQKKINLHKVELCNVVAVLDPDDSIARNRGRRAKKDKTGRLAALEKLKKAKEKGEKWKYEVS